MNTYLTELTAVGPDGVLRVYAGEEIQAITWGMAEMYCQQNGLGYLRDAALEKARGLLERP